MRTLTNLKDQLDGIIECAQHAIYIYDDIEKMGELDDEQTVSEITLSGIEECVKRIRAMNIANKARQIERDEK